MTFLREILYITVLMLMLINSLVFDWIIFYFVLHCNMGNLHGWCLQLSKKGKGIVLDIAPLTGVQ